MVAEQKEDLVKFDQVKQGRKDHALEPCQNRWIELSPELKKMEPHSPYAFKRALFRESMYKDIVRKMRLNWIGHMLTPPLLLTLDSKKNLDEAKEEQKWE